MPVEPSPGAVPSALPDAGTPVRFDRARTFTLAAAILTIALVGIGLSLTLPLLSVRLDAAGFSGRFIGLNTAMGGLATILGAPLVPALARRLGSRALLLVGLALGAGSLLAFPAAPSYWAWFPIRFAFGFALTVLFVMSEFWINAAAPEAKRGLVMGIYGTVLSLGFSTGPVLLRLLGTDGLLPFAVGAAIFALAALPLALVGSGAPDVGQKGHASILSCLRGAPAASFAGFVYGAVESGAFGLLPVYGDRLGFGALTASLLLSAVALGNVAFQIPLGLLSDRIDRTRLLIGCGIAGLAGSALLPVVSGSLPLFAAVLFVWGGLAAGLYTVGLALLGQSYRGSELATANATFVLLYSAGMLSGPPAVGLAMDVASPHGFAAAIAGFFAFYVVVVLFGRFSATDRL